MLPNVLAAAFTKALHSSKSATLARKISAFPPASSISFFTKSAFSSFPWKCTATDAPSFARAMAIAFPIPPDAPVTIAVFPSNNISITPL